ncbi:glycosyltransferase [Collimonas humicola]|uniref:glycosyltransferase n=1 Tax=Collimonas humicola TaxID=2825886 RepID=UPI001B8B11FB|nr:glycosyltransferase [Collimonas humicola]
MENSQKKLFSIEYELHINKLKVCFLEYQQSRLGLIGKSQGKIIDDEQSGKLLEKYETGVANLRAFVASNFSLFDAKNCSSLFCVPTQSIMADERSIHRIWMGGSLPHMTREAIFQWGQALEETKNNNDLEYTSILWVWNAAQLRDDSSFRLAPGDEKYTIGRYAIGNHILRVNSLHELAIDFSADNFNRIDELHAKKYFATLSDYFRFLILIEFGGIYMDADTIPYKSATIFLVKPEIPNYAHIQATGNAEEIRQYHMSWLNLFLDETGMIIAKKDDMSLKVIMGKINDSYRKITGDIPEKNSAYELILFNEFYQEWKNHIGCTFSSYSDFFLSHSVLYDGKKESVICGIRGMRLSVDVITNIEIPLNTEEKSNYDKCINALNAVNWTLGSPCELERVADIFHVNEIPRIAYAPQIRSDIEHYHYYSVLSDDENLDKVNALFGEYLIEKNKRKIQTASFWHKTKGDEHYKKRYSSITSHLDARIFENKNISASNINVESNDFIHFVPGHLVDESHKNLMAELLFSTSYLEYCSFGNALNMNFAKLQKIQNIDPYINHIHGVYNNNEFIGFSLQELLKISISLR